MANIRLYLCGIEICSYNKIKKISCVRSIVSDWFLNDASSGSSEMRICLKVIFKLLNLEVDRFTNTSDIFWRRRENSKIYDHEVRISH